MLSLKHLKYVDAIAEHGSLTAASEALDISPPALSKSIRSLEDQLGTPLFDRKGRVLTLNQFGAVFALEARRMVTQADALEAHARAVSRGEQINLRIGAGPVPSEVIFPRAFTRLARKHDKLSFEVVEGNWPELSEQLLDYRLDLIVIDPDDLAQDPSREKFQGMRLSPITSCMYCRNGHPILQREPDLLNAVLEQRWVGPRIPEHYLDELQAVAVASAVKPAYAARRIPELPDIRLAGFHTCLQIVRESDYLGYGPAVIGDPYVKRGELTRLPQLAFQSQIAVITHADRTLHAGAQHVIDAIVAATEEID